MHESGAVDERALASGPATRVPVRAISLAIALAMLLYVAMVTLANRYAFGKAVTVIGLAVWAQVAGLSLLSYLVRFARWHRFLRALGYRIPVVRDLEIYLSAFALTLTPGKAGETVRSLYLQPYGVGYPQSIGAFVSERLLDLVAVGLLAAFNVVAFPEWRIWSLGFIACGIATLLLLRSRLTSLLARRLASRPLGRHASEGISTIRFLLSGWRIAAAAPLSVLAWAIQGYSLFLVVEALGYNLPVLTVVAIYCLSILAGAASFIPGGLGATEATIVLLLTGVGVGPGDAIVASLICRGLTLWIAVGIGVAAMVRVAVLDRRSLLRNDN